MADQLTHDGLSDERIKEILKKSKRVAVVGMSRDPSKPFHYVPKFLIRQGYKVIPVNLFADETHGLKVYEHLCKGAYQRRRRL